MCLSCSSEQRHEKFQKLSANCHALDSRATVYEWMNGNHIVPSVKISPIDMKIPSCLYLGFFLSLSSYLMFAASLWDLQGCS